MHDVLTHTSPCIYLTYFLSIEMKVQYRLPSTRICVVKYLCYNRLHGICFKYNYVYRNTNHINNDFYTQENKYSKKVSFPKYSSTGCYSFSKKKSLASPIQLVIMILHSRVKQIYQEIQKPTYLTLPQTVTCSLIWTVMIPTQGNVTNCMNLQTHRETYKNLCSIVMDIMCSIQTSQ